MQEVREERGQRSYLAQDTLLTRIELDCSGAIRPWGHVEYMETLTELAQEMDMDLDACARRFGTITLPESTHGWSFHPALGFGAIA